MEFEIFKTGTHTSDKGITKNYTESDLNFIASSYNPTESEAPIVVGHPVDNSPAFGWIESLKVVGDKLIAKAKDVVPEFLDVVKQGIYKKRSISLDKDGKLRHVGFLGGAAPAVKGLADISFSSQDNETIEFDSSVDTTDVESPLNSDETPTHEYNGMTVNDHGMTMNDNDHPKNNPSVPELLNTFSDTLKNIQTLVSEVAQNFSDKSPLDEIRKIQTDIDEMRLKINISEFEMMLNEKLAYGSLTPAMKEKIIKFLDYLNTFNFSDQNSYSTLHKQVITMLTDIVQSIPKIVHFENFAEKPTSTDSEAVDNYSGLPVDENSLSIHKQAIRMMQKDNITYLSAITNLLQKE